MVLFDSSGQPFQLDSKLGQGGEGTVYSITNRPGTVAKVYHQQPSGTLTAKLDAMVRAKSDSLLRTTAWPIDVVHSSKGGPIVGLLMPSVVGHKPIINVYNPKARMDEYPEASWLFCLKTATNLARAFHTVHEHGHVVGDVNPGNAVVSKQATVRLIDCDSFQITYENNTYNCNVGIPEYQPPEMLNYSNYRGIKRTADYDRFGLAILIFQLLFLGRHPFAGRYIDSNDMTIQRAIQESRFAYGAGLTSRRMAPPPGLPTLYVLSTPIVQLFERAFLYSGTRPIAAEWIHNLSDLESKLKVCDFNRMHLYLNILDSCPWCEYENNTGKEVFKRPNDPINNRFSIDTIWKQIETINAPIIPKLPPIIAVTGVTPNPIYTKWCIHQYSTIMPWLHYGECQWQYGYAL